ncbi:BIG1-domain-containing protein [Decorospora gaudefroyi]|uniref:Protein BIG1 n=1 Tax=Decorospora gaudefroyi TaxID=184978 RepID=A0A6A5KN14_9PLEO|nr:BIG1-domain-containing protein [Decorospora gaudefroyi]
MAKTLVGALALAALPPALAFRNTSPFFLFSTAELLMPNNDASIAESSQVTARVLNALEHCPTHSYLVVEQPGVSSNDYADGHAAPQLSRYMAGNHDQVRTTLAIPEIVGHVDAAAITDFLRDNCAKDGNKADESWLRKLVAQPPAPSQARRVQQLQSDDARLEEFITNDAKSQDYTVIYVTTPQTESQAKEQLKQEQYTYEMETSFPDAVQMELKRDLSSHAKRDNATEGGLFEKYQYFTPGIFMGLAAIIPLFLILLVGIRALTSLEVSYFAFSKEMGPHAQKKQ